tara:strand:+ start:377 stop:859 length:483 start_codon:yes stop_codon:yes gene_type:complete
MLKTIEETILRLYYHEMKTKSGIVVVGGRNDSKENVFDSIGRLLFDFYQERGSELETLYLVDNLIVVTKIFQNDKDKYYCPIYIPSESANVKHGQIKIEWFNEERYAKFVKEWDFPHAPFEYSEQIFGVYFNIPDFKHLDIQKSLYERDSFVEFSRIKRL